MKNHATEIAASTIISTPEPANIISRKGVNSVKAFTFSRLLQNHFQVTIFPPEPI